MTSAVGLALFAVAASTLGPLILRDRPWMLAMPRLGILAWQTLSASIVAAVALAGGALTIGLTHVSADLASFVHLCAMTVRHNYESPGGTVAPLAGAVVALAVLARTWWCLAKGVVAQRRERTRAIRVLDVVGHHGRLPGVLVLDHDTPYAFCVPGRRSRIVVTSGLLSSLNPRQVRAVLAHERGHLESRHHLPLLLADALATAFGRVAPVFEVARREVAFLIEVSADDDARQRVGDAPLREALARLTETPVPRFALAAAACGVKRRLHRLTSPTPAASGPKRAALACTIALAGLMPLGIAAAPTVAAAWDGLCLIA